MRVKFESELNELIRFVNFIKILGFVNLNALMK